MEDNKPFKNCVWLLSSHTLVTFNDNLAKYMLLGLCGWLMTKVQFEQANAQIGILLVLPFILFAPLAGWLADARPKKTVISATLLAQVGGLGVIAYGMHQQSLHLALTGFFLLAVQTIFFSPARYGIIKELVDSRQLGLVIGWTEMLGYSAVLVGAFAGGVAFEQASDRVGNDGWKAGLIVTVGIAVLSVISWFLFQPTKKAPASSQAPLKLRNLFGHFHELRETMQDRGLRLSLLGFAWFIGVAWLVILCLSLVAKGIAGGNEVGKLTGIFNLFLGVGVMLGSVFTAYVNRGRVELGTVAVGAIGMAAALFLSGLTMPEKGDGHGGFNASLVLMGFSGAIFSVPLRGFMVDRAGEERRGRVLASSTLLSNLFGLAFIGVHFLLLKLGLDARKQFLFMALPSLLVTSYVLKLLPEALFRTLVLVLTRLFYRLQVCGIGNIPATGGALLVANHISYADPPLIAAACPRPVRFIGFSGLAQSKLMRWIFKVSGVIPVSPKQAREAITKAAEHVANGEIVCIFPEGAISRTGAMQGLKRGFELIARRAQAPVIPVGLDGLWGSIFSYERNKFFNKKPLRIPYPARVSFGTPMDTKDATNPAARQALQDLAEEAFSQRPALQGHLGHAAFIGLASMKSREILIDHTQERRPIQAHLLLALGLAFRDRLAKATSAKRVGIVLPPGIGATVANLACVLGGKIPVNLNFSLGKAALESCVRRADIDTLITTAQVQKRCPNLPKTPTTLDIKDELDALPKSAIAIKLAPLKLLPAGLAACLLKIPQRGDREEAALIFTSGSSGEPKGVVLSHRNLLGNIEQISDINLIDREQTLLGNLPLFHSFGFLVTLWYPLVKGIRLVTLPTPLEVRKAVEAIHQDKVTALLGTPTFLKPYLRKADPEKLASLKFVIAGAEKTPEGLAQQWESKFGSKYLEGYGLTETSPVSSVNLPDPHDADGQTFKEYGSRPGAAGRLLPGLTIRFIDPDTGEEKPYGESGIITLKGTNIFEGYHGQQDKTDEVLRDGWFTTGDLGRLDQDGFLHIEGRLSRFSKIGGEMVPHGTVEEAIVKALKLDPTEDPAIAIAGRPDPAKGEALVLLHSLDIDLKALRTQLSEAGLANLWIPKATRKVDAIPTLATGKLDLKGIKELAEQA